MRYSSQASVRRGVLSGQGGGGCGAMGERGDGRRRFSPVVAVDSSERWRLGVGPSVP
jgi:hypothetical protein